MWWRSFSLHAVGPREEVSLQGLGGGLEKTLAWCTLDSPAHYGACPGPGLASVPGPDPDPGHDPGHDPDHDPGPASDPDPGPDPGPDPCLGPGIDLGPDLSSVQAPDPGSDP